MSQWNKHNINIKLCNGCPSGAQRYHGGLTVTEGLGGGDCVVIISDHSRDGGVRKASRRGRSNALLVIADL